MIARALTRKGSILVKMAKKELEQQEYFDPKIADEGVRKQKYPEAVKHYTESLKRSPKDPKAYETACFINLGALA
ncbi:hypothetical protein CDL15_Pgr014933 [Punica granatum]|uniref:Uncharacterized protein n=1 Tax=Punica granatum TaxID=22663 RepID=A0A218WZH8_PUNGR|nr:hypothetical protein CDL15_Pgr014933 [Punica granatum]